MGFTINDSGRLLRDGRQVELIAARPSHTGGNFARTPKVIVMHFTFGGSGRSSADWFRDPNNQGKSSAHVVIDRDGTVLQCVSFEVIAHHAGRSEWKGTVGMNSHSFGIELANWGNLKRGANGWVSWTGVQIADPEMAVHKNGNPDGSVTPIGWERYREAQIEAAEGVAKAIIAKYGCDEIIGHDDISRGRKWDPGPAFDMGSFRARVLEDMADDGDNTLRVTVVEGLNLRKGPGTSFDVLELLPAGTALRPVERNGSWILVNVLNNAGVARRTGWVHSAFVD